MNISFLCSCYLLPQGYIQWHRFTQETIFFLLFTFKLFRQDHSLQAKDEVGLLQQVFSEVFAHSRQVYSTLILGILFQLIPKSVTG